MPMNYLIFSDIHGSQTACEKAISFYDKFDCNKIIILGDILYHGPRNPLPQGYNPKGTIEILNKYAQNIFCCRGNCDSEVDQMVLNFQISADFIQLFDSKFEIFCTHGHIYAPILKNGEKPQGCESAQKTPKIKSPYIFFYGHTHIPILENHNGSIICNPGSVSLPKENSQASFAVLQTKGGNNSNNRITLYNINGNELKNLTF